MRLRARFFFTGVLFFVALGTIQAALVPGQTYVLKFVDVDGHALSTAEGRTTVVVLSTSADTARARVVGDRIPDFCLANPSYRMITILNLNRKYQRFARRTAAWLIRRGLNAEAKRLQQRYDVKKIQGDARRDVFAVADFDGTLTSQLGVKPAGATFAVFVFGRDGKLLRQWSDIPSAAELAEALR